MQGKGVEPPNGQAGQPGLIRKPVVNVPHADTSTENDPINASSTSNTQGNATKPTHTPSIIDQLSRTKTKEEIANQKRAKAQGLDKLKSVEEPVAETPVAEAPRGRDPSQAATTATATATTTATSTTTSTKPKHPDDERPSMALAPKSTRVQERDISPGTLPDGSHVKCSGEKGESYTPPTGLGKLAGKIRHAAH